MFNQDWLFDVTDPANQNTHLHKLNIAQKLKSILNSHNPT
jgi:hypothetical protein